MFDFFRKIFKKEQESKYIFSKPSIDIIDRGGNNIVTFRYHTGQVISKNNNINKNVFLSTTIVNDTKYISEKASEDYFYLKALENLHLEWFLHVKVDSIIGVENGAKKDRYAFCDFDKACPQYKILYSRYFGV